MVSSPNHIHEIKRRARESFYDGDYELMSDLLKEAWAAAVTENDPSICSSIAHTASDLFNRAGKQDQALVMAYSALEHKRLEGSVDHELANYLCFLAQLLGKMGKATEAVPYAEQGVEAFAKLWGEDHRETLMVRALLQGLRSASE